MVNYPNLCAFVRGLRYRWVDNEMKKSCHLGCNQLNYDTYIPTAYIQQPTCIQMHWVCHFFSKLERMWKNFHLKHNSNTIYMWNAFCTSNSETDPNNSHIFLTLAFNKVQLKVVTSSEGAFSECSYIYSLPYVRQVSCSTLVRQLGILTKQSQADGK